MQIMDPQIFEAVKAVMALAGTVIFGFVGFWCKSMAKDIKDLQVKEQQTQVFIAEIQAGVGPRAQLQDERWDGLKKDIGSLQRHIEALVHSQINKQ